MPAFKGSIDKSLGRKFLDGAKYLGKNSWKVLPVAGAVDFTNKRLNGMIKPSIINHLKSVYHLTTFSLAVIYCVASIENKSLNPQKWLENKNKIQYQNQINSSYKALFKDAKTFSDSLVIYQHYGLSLKLKEPNFEEKETAVKINELEKSLK